METNQPTENNPIDPQNNSNPIAEQGSDNTVRKIETSFFDFLGNSWHFLRDLLNIHEGTNVEGTIEGIKRDIEFKGVNVYILIFSIFIASIGLNTNSTAVIIGAMLISPLMGPILGVGLAVGTNDWALTKKSLRNLGITVTIAIITSTIYFSISPLSDIQSELLARTRPTVLDVLVALFGGLAGIVAGSRKEKTNVIPGVAIATALMPPLCTAGYGLATAQWNFFFGAFYLFLLNSIFIAISTLIVVRYLKFPIKEFVDPVRERKARLYIVLFVLVVIIPSGFIFVEVVRESIFLRNANNYVSEVVDFEGTTVFKKEFNYNDGKNPDLQVFMYGEFVPAKVTDSWQRKLASHGLETASITFHQTKEPPKMDKDYNQLVEKLSEVQKEVAQRDNTIRDLQQQILSSKGDTLPFTQVLAEAQIQYPALESAILSSGKKLANGATQNCLVLVATWNEDLDAAKVDEESAKVEKWLAIRLKQPVEVINAAQ